MDKISSLQTIIKFEFKNELGEIVVEWNDCIFKKYLKEAMHIFKTKINSSLSINVISQDDYDRYSCLVGSSEQVGSDKP